MKISNFKFQISNYKKGFTLIEMVVVMAVFLFIIGAAITIFISVVSRQKEVLSEQQLLNQVSYTEEYMSKSLRMAKKEFIEGCLVDTHSATKDDHPGYFYLLTRYDSSSTSYRGIKFLNSSGTDSSGSPITVCQEFFLAGTGTPTDPYILKELKNSTDDGDAVALTSANMHINSLKFAINGYYGINSPTCSQSKCGASDADTVQPRVTILLNVKIPGDAIEPDRMVQTTVSDRNLNVVQ
jgi:prepilin-type N-terminal cleavage/methylation domain-containing protein